MDSTQLEHRLNRIQGQIEAIKKNFKSGPNTCTEVMWLFKTVQSGLRKTAEEYISLYAEDCLQSGKKGKITKKQIQTIVSSAFNV